MIETRTELIVLAREARGMTQEALASAAGVAQGTISKVEAGITPVSEELLSALAKALDFPVAFFSRDIRTQELPPSFFRRRVTGLSARTLKEIRAHWAIMLRNLSVLLAPVEFPELRIPEVDLRATGIRPERAARDLRVQLHLPIGPVANLTLLIERAGVLVVPFDFGTDRIDGMSVFDRQLGLPPVIFFNDGMPGDRQRFTLAHELGHIIMHSHLPFVDGDAEDIEGQADAFASELLMPSDDIRGQLLAVSLPSLCGMKLYWRVSIAALLMKADLLNLVGENRVRYLWREISRRGWRLHEPNPIPREEPGLFRQLIEIHEKKLNFSEDDLCAALCVSRSDLRRRYPVSQARSLRLVT